MAKHSQRHVLAADVAAAATTNELPARYTKPTHANLLIDVAKRLQRLQTRAARLRKELKRTDQEIKHARRELGALAQQLKRGE
jgi:Skp family chaperone for outer membrane proteins